MTNIINDALAGIAGLTQDFGTKTVLAAFGGIAIWLLHL